MEYPTIRLVFDRKHTATKTTKGLVQIEVRYQGKRKFIGTGIKLHAGEWKPDARVVNHLEAASLNSRLSAQVSSIEDFVTDKIKKGDGFSLEMLDYLGFKKMTDASFIDFMAERIESRKDIEESTKKQHRRALTALEEFGKIRLFSDVTKANIVLFDDWLHTFEYKQTTVYGYHKRIKSYINDAIERELLQSNPYASLKFARGKSDGLKYLLRDELYKIEQATMPNLHLERARDLFVFQCYTGLAYSDMAKFKWEDVQKQGDNYVIKDVRRKTDEEYYILLLKPALRILQKYDMTLPSITNQRYNDFLKSVASIAGVHKPISSHWGRHTFAVMALSMGARMQNVSKMLGHATMAITESVYAKVLADDVRRDFEMMNEKL